MSNCIICNTSIKEDHAYCPSCYEKMDKSVAIKKCKEYYNNNLNDTIYCYDNYNNSLKYFPNICGFSKWINIASYGKYEIRKKPSANSSEVLKVLEENKELLDKLRLGFEYSSLSYLDSLWLLKQVFDRIDNDDIIMNTSIYMEYRVPNLLQERIDYILLYKNKMIFIEFGQSDVTPLNELSKKKEKQLNRYARAMKKEFPDLKIKNIVKEIFVYKSDKVSIENSLNHLAKMINIHFVEKTPSELLNMPR